MVVTPGRCIEPATVLKWQSRYFQCLYERTILVLIVHYGSLSACVTNYLLTRHTWPLDVHVSTVRINDMFGLTVIDVTGF